MAISLVLKLTLIYLTVSLLVAAVSAESGAKVKDIRLPTSIRPLYYKLDLIPLLDPKENYTLHGSVAIKVEVLEPTSNITLHVKKLTIQEDSVKVSKDGAERRSGKKPASGSSILVTKQMHDEAREFYILFLEQELEAGKTYTVFMNYTGIVSDDLSGFYRSTYTDRVTNETRTIAVTQFEATDARKAFPCFDEPAFKAEFEVSVARLENMTSISNMELNRSEHVGDRPGYIWDHYGKSVPMSTYLVALVVSDFVKLEADPKLSDTKFAIWARKDAEYQAELAKDAGPRILKFFEDYFQVKFPLPKQDMVAIPDFGPGAMENWGLITYRERAILHDPKVASDNHRYYVISVISHELAHQWFGNLVTMSWWTDLWLNEGFASYVEYLGIDAVAPEFKTLETFVIDEIQNVFISDALDSSHPISVPVHHPDEIHELFDRISYAKGASIIRMMNLFLTEKTFRQGLTNYLRKWSYNNTEQTDLWDALTEQARLDRTLPDGVSVRDIMDTWTLQKGFPVIDVIRKYPKDSEDRVTFKQTKFQAMTDVGKRERSEKYLWWVPISFASPSLNSDFSKTQPEFWLTADQRNSTCPINIPKDQWLVVNVQEGGYYRVNYDLKNWQLISDQLSNDNTKIHVINRAQILDDALNLAKSNLLPYEVALNLTRYLKDEKQRLPFESFFNNFAHLNTLLSKTAAFGMYKKYLRSVLGPQYESVGLRQREGETVQDRLHRVKVASWACGMGYEKCIKESLETFVEWMTSPDPENYQGLPMASKPAVFTTGIKYGGEKEWNFLWKMYTRSNLASDRELMLTALGATRDPWLINRYLDWAFTSGSGIRKSDAGSVIRGLLRNDVAWSLAFNFVRSEYTRILNYFPASSSFMGRIIESIGSRLSTPFELEQLLSLRNNYKDRLGRSARAFERAIERAEANIMWVTDHYDTVNQWFTEAVQDY